MQPIKVQIVDPAGTPAGWGWWVDTVANGAVEAVIIPIGGQGAANRNPAPITVNLNRIQVLNGQNQNLPLDEPTA